MEPLDRFSNRYVIKGKIELKTPMRIGGGQNAALYSISPAPVIECYDAGSGIFEPYIPGSSLKGVLRSALERLIRTFDDSRCCISVGDRKSGDMVLCGKESCVCCQLFGSMKGGAKIRVRDSHLTDECRSMADRRGYLREQPHFGSPKPHGDGIMRPEESVSAGTAFSFQIDLDNGTDEEAGLIVLALLELNEHRAHLGGGVTRGHGFCSVPSWSVTRITMDDGMMHQERRPKKDCIVAAKQWLSCSHKSDGLSRDFDRYYKAFTPAKKEWDDGHVVATLIVTCCKDFAMKGLDEPTVTNGLLPVIPGSTIKGFFRHTLEKEHTDNIMKSIFGNTSTRGRLIVSDAWPEGKGSIGDDIIPQGTTLKMYMVFDNMTSDEMGHITKFFEKEIQITGNTSAGKTRYSPAQRNLVKISVHSVKRFSASDYLAG